MVLRQVLLITKGMKTIKIQDSLLIWRMTKLSKKPYSKKQKLQLH